MSDTVLHEQLKAIGDTYLRLAEDRAVLAMRQAEHWTLMARLEKRSADRKRADWRKPHVSKTPSGTFAGVHEALAPIVDHSRAKTEKHDMTAFVEEAEAEHRPTPVVQDFRKEPE